MKLLLAFTASLAILTAASYAARAGCTCMCKDSKLTTRCTDPTSIERCQGFCLGDMCIGLCSPDHGPAGGIAAQSQIDREMREYRFRYSTKPGPDGKIEH